MGRPLVASHSRAVLLSPVTTVLLSRLNATDLTDPLCLRGYPESYAALLFGYLKGDGFHASSGASLLNIPPMALILTQASLDSGNHS
jgi:hypothetical protein